VPRFALPGDRFALGLASGDECVERVIDVTTITARNAAPELRPGEPAAVIAQHLHESPGNPLYCLRVAVLRNDHAAFGFGMRPSSVRFPLLRGELDDDTGPGRARAVHDDPCELPVFGRDRAVRPSSKPSAAATFS
jgi:hypothetical protein